MAAWAAKAVASATSSDEKPGSRRIRMLKTPSTCSPRRRGTPRNALYPPCRYASRCAGVIRASLAASPRTRGWPVAATRPERLSPTLSRAVGMASRASPHAPARTRSSSCRTRIPTESELRRCPHASAIFASSDSTGWICESSRVISRSVSSRSRRAGTPGRDPGSALFIPLPPSGGVDRERLSERKLRQVMCHIRTFRAAGF